MYTKVLEQLKHREITTEDYEILLTLENKMKNVENLQVPFEKFCAMAFIKEYKILELNQNDSDYECAICKEEIEDNSQGIKLKNCDHKVHK